MYDLSILIPARNEQFISNTVDNILKNKRGKTEILVGLDSEWANPPIVDHPDVKIIYLSESIGQRAMQNKLASLSQAKYVAKTDAHCTFSEGFDVELMKTFEELGDDITVAPLMKNLQAFDWKCMKCGSKWYQGPSPTKCMIRGKRTSDMEPNPDCDNTTDFTQKIVFAPRPDTPRSTSYLFDNMLHFQYFNEYKEKQQGDLVESMSLQGSFFMCTRENYWKKELCDETWGSWGQQGSEVAIKTWLSGGRVIINKRVWYAHLFRTQMGFSFPYQQSGKQQQRARDICNDVFKNNKWDQQIHPLSWLVEKFWPVPRWTDEQLQELKKSSLAPGVSKGILYFTDGELPDKISKPVLDRLQEIAQAKNMPLEISLMEDDETRGYLTMFKQILRGLERLRTDIVFMAEHDVLYPPEHFDFTPAEKGKFYYDQNWWKIHEDGFAIHWDADQVSGLCAYRDDLIEYYKYRIDSFDKDNFDRKFEPFSGEKSEPWKASVPHIDIRHGKNLTYNKRSLDDFRKKDTAVNLETSTIDKIPGWELNVNDIY